MKKCNKCGKTKNKYEFYKNIAASDGLYQYCKKCKIKMNTEYKNKKKDGLKALDFNPELNRKKESERRKKQRLENRMKNMTEEQKFWLELGRRFNVHKKDKPFTDYEIDLYVGVIGYGREYLEDKRAVKLG